VEEQGCELRAVNEIAEVRIGTLSVGDPENDKQITFQEHVEAAGYGVAIVISRHGTLILTTPLV
jgi:hypothetical protein